MPIEHAPYVSDLQPETAGQMFLVARQLVAAARASPVRCEGVNLILADGASAGQEVFHAHLHVLPRFAGDGFGFRFPEGYGSISSREELDRIAAAIRCASVAD